MWKQLHGFDGKPMSIEVTPGETYTLAVGSGHLRACAPGEEWVALAETVSGTSGVTFTIPANVTHISIWYKGKGVYAPQLYRGEMLKPFNLVEHNR